MASTLEARRLTEAHRQAQARLGAQTVQAMRSLWPLLDGEALDATTERWSASALRVVRLQRSSSATLGANYVKAFRRLELGTTAPPPIVLADELVVEQVASSLIVTGPVAVKRAMARGLPLAAAMANAEATSAAAALRHALGGGRDTITATTDADPQALGWARAASGNACAFCAMIAGRGPVYKSDGSADFEAHDSCSCTAEPVYREGAAWPAGSQQYASLWQEAREEPGDTTANFRRLLSTP